MFKGRSEYTRLKRYTGNDRRLFAASLVEWADDNVHEKEENVSRKTELFFLSHR